MTHVLLLLKRYRRETQVLNGQYLAQGCTAGSHVGESRFQQATLNQNPHPHSKMLCCLSCEDQQNLRLHQELQTLLSEA